MSDTNQAKFDGWAIVDVLGHQRHVGYVTTKYFGQTAFFQVETPARCVRRRTLDRDEWLEPIGRCPEGAVVTEAGADHSVRMVGAGSIYQIEPTTEEAVFILLDAISPRTVLSAVDKDGKTIERLVISDDGIPF